MTQGNALQNWQHIYQLSRLNIQRCVTYTYVHVCGYLFSTVVCYGYVCLFVYTCTSACSCVYLDVLTYCLAICLFPMCWFFSSMYTYWINDFWFLKSSHGIFQGINPCHLSVQKRGKIQIYFQAFYTKFSIKGLKISKICSCCTTVYTIRRYYARWHIHPVVYHSLVLTTRILRKFGLLMPEWIMINHLCYEIYNNNEFIIW